MPREIIIQSEAEAILEKLPKHTQERILKKIIYFGSLADPKSRAIPMKYDNIGHRRWRIGDYRVIFDIDNTGNIIIVLIIGHRKNIYL